MPVKQQKIPEISLKYVYQRALEAEKRKEQWQKVDALEFALEYHYKMMSAIEMLENRTVFSIGDGADGFKDFNIKRKTLSQRLHSFDKMFKEEQSAS